MVKRETKGAMAEFKKWMSGLLGAVVRVVLWLIMAVVAVFLLAVALVLLFLGVLWALLRGQRPETPVFVGRFQRFTKTRVWPQAGQARASGASARHSQAEVVDVEAREVDERSSRSSADERSQPEDRPGLEDRRP